MSKGIIRFLAAVIAGIANTPSEQTGQKKMGMMQHKNMLVINGYAGPMPARIKNQRQKRKAARRASNWK